MNRYYKKPFEFFSYPEKAKRASFLIYESTNKQTNKHYSSFFYEIILIITFFSPIICHKKL